MKKRNASYTQELKTFAVTLHFHSPAAYKYVRSSFLKCLPHETTLRRWMRNLNNEPGICEQAIQEVRNQIYQAKKINKELIFNLVFDEMSIRKKIEFVNGEAVGFVDLGNGVTSQTEASQALVFMIVNINGNFKIPIAYYLIASLMAQEKVTILSEILRYLHENEIDVRSVISFY
ncbi:THAP domain-containing protein 9 [Cyphomyrmex costatus]|uniref:THAP domain-containing protein 9 n=1 Tax=Cyphomyrmex costatus TaxID=456900 RepID=A0A151IFN2_9HYME|nr:THAP domain-containing protein 9 [Cyphomyrmex costatus]